MASERHAGDFGAKLREARERRGLSLRTIADTTRISVRALEALERNDIARLPGGIFSRSFVRAYAVEIGLDPEQTVAEFITRFPDEIVTQGHPRTRDLVAELENDERPRVWITPLRVALVMIPLLALATYFVVSGRRSTPPPPSATPVGSHQSGRTGEFAVTIHALRSTRFSIAPDRLAPTEVSLDGGESRQFEAKSELHIFPVEPSALEWSINGLPPRGMTGPITITPERLMSAAIGR
ncbi:MAG: helix-turn-helix transcriptional regulator [Vicinamibacterales bacterium]